MAQDSVATPVAPHTRSATLRADDPWSARSAALGAALWMAAPFVPTEPRPSFGALEHTFLFLPLVAAPLALRLLSRVLAPPPSPRASVLPLVRHAQPFAAAMLLGSFFVPEGGVAGALAAGWLIVAGALAVAGAGRSMRLRSGRHQVSASSVAAHVFLPIGAAWLTMSRLGVAPPRLAPLTVFLAAVHFHYSGFILQILIAATGRSIPDRRAGLAAVHRGVAFGAIVGIPIIAAGNIADLPVLKHLGVSAMVLSTLGLATISAVIATELPSQPSRWFLLASAASIAAAMILAGVYGVGEIMGRSFIAIPRMAATHGLLNAVGFSLCGLVGHLLLRPGDGQPATS